MKTTRFIFIIVVFLLSLSSVFAQNTALRFNGTTDKINLGNPTTLNINNNITLEAWIRLDAIKTGWSPIVTKGSDQAWRLQFNNAGTNLEFALQGVNNTFTSTKIFGPCDLGVWHHVACVYNGSQMFIYINGQLDRQVAASGTFQTTALNAMIGGTSNQASRSFPGTIDEVRIWNIPRSQAQIQSAMTSSIPGVTSGLVAYFDLQEGIPFGNNTAITTIASKFGAPITGTVVGFTKTGSTSNWVTGLSLPFPTTSVVSNIIDFQPRCGSTGSIVTIFGSNLTSATQVSFAGTNALAFRTITSGIIVATVVGNATGNVAVTNACFASTLGGYNTRPILNSATPTSGVLGTAVTLLGSNFTNTTSVLFGSLTASSFVVVNSSTIVAVVGPGVSTTASVLSPCGNVSIGGLSFGVTISNIAPNTIYTGQTVTISGFGFTPGVANTKVWVGNILANVISATSNTVVFQAPAAASNDYIVLNTGNRVVSSPKKISITNGTSCDRQGFVLSALPYFVGNQGGASGDLNNDGLMDFFAYDNSWFHLFSSSPGTYFPEVFASPFIFPLSRFVFSDMNEDGFLDVAGAGTSSFTFATIITGTGTNTFGSAPFNPANQGANLVVEDFNKDGKQDFANTSGNTTGRLYVYLRNSTGFGFTSTTLTTTGSGAWNVQKGDFNNDGFVDLVTTHTSSPIASIFRNINGNFVLQSTLPTIGESRGVVVDDFNNDGIEDISIAQADGDRVRLYIGAGNFNFTLSATATVTPSPREIVSGDWNGDGNIDIAVYGFVGATSNTLTVLTGSGIGTLGVFTSLTGLSSGTALEARDYDNDGYLDLGRIEPGPINLYLNKCLPRITGFTPTNPTIGNPFTINGSNFASNMANNSIRIDGINVPILSGSSTQLVGIMPFGVSHNRIEVIANGWIATSNRFTTSFGPPFCFGLSLGTGTSVSLQPRVLKVADINNDGRLDIITGHRGGSPSIGLKLGNGNYTFGASVNSVVANGMNDMAVIDINNDGRPDAISTAATTISVLTNVGTGFATKRDYTITTGFISNCLAVGDINKDGWNDVVVAGLGAVYSLMNQGNGTFSSGILVQNIASPAVKMQLADVNNDSFLDILIATANNLNVLLGSASGVFSVPNIISISGANSIFDINIGDYNNDGILDVACISNGSNLLHILRGNGIGGFTFYGNFNVNGTGPTAIHTADVNSDGILDISVAFNPTSNINTMIGSGGGDFPAAQTFNYALITGGIDIAVADLNNDGRHDVLGISSGFGTVFLFPNVCPTLSVTSISPSVACGGSVINSGVVGNSSAFLPSNTFTLQLSDASGSFASPTVLRTITTSFFSIYPATIPGSVLPGNNYRVRVLSSSPSITGTGISPALVISSPASISGINPVSVAPGAVVSIFGSNFINVSAVYFGSTSASSFVVTSPTLIQAVVGSGSSGLVRVATSCNTASFASISVIAPASALDFDGTNDYINISPVIPYSNDFTVEAWIQKSSPSGVIFGWAGSTFTTFEIYNNRIRLTTYDGTYHYSDGGTDVTSGLWTHVAATRSGNQIRLYLNGNLDGTYNTSKTPNPSTSSIGSALLFGFYQNFFKGSIDNLRIWNRPLCQSEIINNRTSENPGNTSGLVAHYKFNQGIANSDNGTVTTALDNIGVYNGTLNGFVLNGSQSNWVNPGAVTQNSNSTFFPNNTSAFISGFSPTSAFTGQVINISGGNFTGSDNVSAVYFGTTPASAFTVPSSAQILATVGGGNTGVLKLNVGCGTATSSGFIYLEPLSISGFTPQRVLPGGTLTILGKGFDSDPLANQVTFDGLFAVVLAATENMLVVRVPLEASINYIYITTGAQSIKSSFPYFVGNRSCSNSSFTSPILYTLPFGDGPIQISSIDINKDTSLDLVIGNYSSGEIKVQRGDGGGTFSLFNTIPTAASPTVMDFGDVNLDGNVDIVCGNTIGYEVFINDGFANLTQLVLNNGGDNVLGIKLTDLNNDGILDLVYSTPLNPSLYVALGNGLGGFINETAQPLGGMNPSKMVSHDFDKDGNMDIAFVDYSTSNFGVLLGKGNGSFQSVVSYPFGGSAGVDRIVTADFDHDGNYDLAMTSYTDQIFAVFRGNGNGTFTPLVSPTGTGGYPNDIQLIDYNGDANIDLIIPIYSTGEVKIFAGNGLGAFSTNPVVISAGSTPNSVAVGDFNRDNQVDFAVTNFSTHQFNVVRNTCPALPKISHNGLWFDGVDDNVTIIRPVQSDFTISFWMKTNSDFVASGTNWYDGAGIIAADNNTPGNLGFGISMTKGYLRYGSGDISTSTMDESTIKVNDNKWHHVLVTRSESSGDVQLYIDGVREIASTQIVGKLDGTPNLVLGRVQTIPQHAYEGQLDDIRFYDREFSAAEIADTSIWNREANTSDASLVAYYKLDRDPINESELIAKDHIGSNDGTIDYLSSGGPLFTRSVTTAAGDYSPGSLRWAIRDFTEGTDQLSGKNYIDFSIQEVDPNIIHTIDFIDSMSIKSDLVLDGFSAYGSSKNTLAEGSDAQLRIALNFSGLVTRRFGIQLNGAKNSLVRGLSFVSMPNDGGGAHALGFAGSSSHNSITGCWFGVYPDGDGSLTYRNMNGVNLDLDVGYNVIGGPLPEHRNCISNTEFNGIVPNSNYNIIQNNYIGTNPSGVSSMGNGERGISIYGIGNLIKENLISGNTNGILGNGSSSLCTIVGNFIGTDVTGVNPLPNTEGIVLGDGNNTNIIQFYTIGDTTKNNGNIIAFNSLNAITLNSLNSTVNNIRISGNTIFENGYGIFLFNGGNQDKVAPSITSAKTFLLSGTCEADDWVELYYDSPAFLGTSQGRRFLGVANTNGTTWSFPTNLALGDRVTALAIKNTNQGGGKNSGLGANAPSEYNTSEFSSAATVNSSTPITQPMGNRGIYFDGNDKYVQVGLSPALNFSGSDDFTIETWVKPATISSMSFYDNIPDNIGANNGMLNIWGSLAANGKVAFGLGPQTQFWDFLYSKSNYEINKWMHIALVKYGNLASIYINGVLDTSMTLSAGTLAATLNNAPINFGRVRIDPMFNFHGQLDEIKVFNVSRSQSEIQQDMSETTSPIAGMVGYWNMDQGIGTTADDISGSFNPGILTNGPLWALRVTDSLDNAGPGLGSLRQAINEANSDFDIDYIDFSIQQSNPATISTINLNTPLSDITNPIYIDGYSAFGSSYNTLTGLTNGTNASIRVELKGTAAFNALSGQQYAIRFLVGSDNSIVKGLAMNNFKLTTSGNDDGALQFLNTNNTQILGCFIGTDAIGTAFIPNTLGIVVSNSSVSIGTAKAENRNLIVGGLTSLQINSSDNSTVKNNLFGVNASLAPLTDSNTSIQIWNTSKNNTIGGINTNEGNIIANNGKGVEVTMDATRNRISQNSIYNNGVGIDLGGGTGNGNKAAPTITSAYPTQVSGSCEAGDIVEVFYDSPQSGTTNQGRVFLGQATTSGTNWTFLATLTVGSRITATATDATSGTSPFSAAATVVNFVPGEALDFDGVDDEVVLPVVPALDFNGTDEFTIETWVKTDANNNASILEEVGGVCAGGNQMGISVVSGNVQFYIDHWCALGAHRVRTIGSPIQAGVWSHIVCIYRKSGDKIIYVNGVLQNLTTIEGTPNPLWTGGNSIWKLGSTNLVYGDLGVSKVPLQLDEFRIWNRALCLSEILNNLNAEKLGNNNGLVVKYDFNQGFSGFDNSLITTLYDSSGNGYDASLANFQLSGLASNWITPGGVLTGSTASSVNCVTAEALDFDGTDDFILLPNGITSQLSGGTMTFESWVKFRGFNNFGSIVKNWSSTGGAFHLGLGDGGVDPWIRRLYLFITQSDGTVLDIGMQSNMLNADVWYHVAFVADGSKISLYVDGLEVDSKPYDGTLKSDVIYSALGVKMDPNSGLPDGVLPGFLNGELDEVRLWSRALCPAEIFNNKNAEKLSNTSGLLFKYDFNQGFVGSANLGLTTLADSSGNGNNATLYNFQLTGSISNWVAPGGVLSGSTVASINCPALAPSPICIYPSNQMVSLAWTPPAATVSGYQVLFGTNTLSGWTSLSVGNVTTYTVTGLTNDQTYYFAVVSNGGDTSSFNGSVPTLESGKAASGFSTLTYVDISTIDLNAYSSYTLEAWVKPNSYGYFHNILEFGNDSPIFAIDDGYPTIYLGIRGSYRLPLNEWSHVAISVDTVSREVRVYINGILDGSTIGYGFGRPNSDGGIGYNNTGDDTPFDGELDEIRIWSSALSTTEVNARKDRPVTGDEIDLVAVYHFDEPSGVKVFDASCSHHDGIWANGPIIVPSKAMHPFKPTNITVSGATFSWPQNMATDVSYYTILIKNGASWDSIATTSNLNYVSTAPCGNFYKVYGVDFSGQKGVMSDSVYLGCPGEALDFDGVDDNVIIPNNSSLNTLPLTVECWMNTTTTGVCYEGLVNKYAASSLNGWSLFHTGGTIQAYYYANSSNFIAFPSTGTGINDGLWHHVAMVVDASGGHIYIDGVLRGRGVWTGTPTACTTNQDLSLGSYPANNQSGACINGYYHGKLDGVRIWSRALCQSEITNNMNAEVPGNSLGLQARYDFNQGFSMSNNAGIATLIDSSGNGNTGTLNNFALVSSTSNWIAPGAVVTGSTTTSINCIPGAALDFNGFNTYVSTNLWSDTLKNFTMEASVYWRGGSAGDQAILYNGLSSSNGYGIVVRQNIGDELTLLLGGSAWILTGTQLPVNSWSKIVVVNDNKNWSLYLNGTALALSSYTDTAITINGITNSFIGNTQSFNSGFNGTIDNVRFWNRPLCQAEINAHLSCEKPSNSTGLIARYDFNSGIAGDNNAGVITAIDSSGNGNHGTLTNFALTSTISNWVAPGAVLSGSTCAGVTIPAGGTWTWVGNSTDWFSPCNWDKLSVPTAASDVVIPGGTLNQPSIRNSPAYCNKIDINTTTGGVVNLDSSSGGQLIITQ